MNLHGPSQTMTNDPGPASRGFIVAIATIKPVVLRPLSHLILWVRPERRERE